MTKPDPRALPRSSALQVCERQGYSSIAPRRVPAALGELTFVQTCIDCQSRRNRHPRRARRVGARRRVCQRIRSGGRALAPYPRHHAVARARPLGAPVERSGPRLSRCRWADRSRQGHALRLRASRLRLPVGECRLREHDASRRVSPSSGRVRKRWRCSATRPRRANWRARSAFRSSRAAHIQWRTPKMRSRSRKRSAIRSC